MMKSQGAEVTFLISNIRMEKSPAFPPVLYIPAFSKTKGNKEMTVISINFNICLTHFFYIIIKIA